MADNTSIQWTDATWNPVVGCSRVSEGCRYCYAERFVHRFAGPGQRWDGLTKTTTSGPRWIGEARLIPERLGQPLRWKRPRRIFVNSMSDLFHESLSNEQIADVFGVMAAASWHTFQVLTKRPARMIEWFEWVVENDRGLGSTPGLLTCNMAALAFEAKHHPKGDAGPLHMKLCADPSGPWPLPNVWLGVSVENQAAADDRIPLLLQVPAVVHFLSCEPLLGHVDLSEMLGRGIVCSCEADRHPPDVRCGDGWIRCNPGTRKVRWVIAGGESGHSSRPMHPSWARSLRDQCDTAGVPFFFKQWGEWVPVGDVRKVCGKNGTHGAEQDFKKIGKHAAGRTIDGCEHSEFPEVPRAV